MRGAGPSDGIFLTLINKQMKPRDAQDSMDSCLFNSPFLCME
jgi:hypothetical protein